MLLMNQSSSCKYNVGLLLNMRQDITKLNLYAILVVAVLAPSAA